MKVEKKIPRVYFDVALFLDKVSRDVDRKSLTAILEVIDIKVEDVIIKEMIRVWDEMCPAGLW